MTDEAPRDPVRPPTELKAENRHLGEHLGNLQYHLTVLEHEMEGVRERLSEIEAAEREVTRRYELTRNQLENVREHLEDEAVSFADTIEESNLSSHQEIGVEDAEFTKGSDLIGS